MGSILFQNHTDKQQSYRGNFSTCSDSHNKAHWFYDQVFSIVFVSKPDLTLQVIFILTILISLIGMVGNGSVIWMLVFCIKKNNFTIYVLNLAIADFGTLMGISAFNLITVLKMTGIQKIHWFFWQFIIFPYSVGLYLLTAIGVERCLSILFPIWVRCHRPKYISIMVSVLFWIASALFTLTEFLLHHFCLLVPWITLLRIVFSVNLFIFTPVMVVSTLILFIKMCFRHQSGKLHTIMLIILIFFIITSIPYGIFFFLSVIDYDFHVIAIPIYNLLVTLNSSINPIIYFFVGNRCNCKSWESIKVVFQNVFKDEAELTEVG
nr:mas-related G-protein coupled receptor member H-like [Anolis sagrei ordinatus]